MKKSIIYLFGIGLTLSSCGSADYSSSAKLMCECMEEKKSSENSSSFGEDVDYASCAFDVVLETRTAIDNSDFGEALEKECPDLMPLHKDYIETVNE